MRSISVATGALMLGLCGSVHAAAQTATPAKTNDPCPAYVPYACKSFAVKAAIARGFLEEFRRDADFETTAASGPYPHNERAMQRDMALKKAGVAAASTIGGTREDPATLVPMLKLWFEFFAAVDEGRQAEQAWYAQPRRGCFTDNAFSFDDKRSAEEKKTEAVQNDITCAHSNDANRLQIEDWTSSKTFHVLVFGSGVPKAEDGKPMSREQYASLVAAAPLSEARRNKLLASFDHAGDWKWDPPELYPGTPWDPPRAATPKQ